MTKSLRKTEVCMYFVDVVVLAIGKYISIYEFVHFCRYVWKCV